jgi:hypothetical protein
MRKWHSESTAERFWSKVDKSGGPDGCWPWAASVNKDGYGRFKARGVNQNAHRVAVELVTNLPLLNLQANHRCDNRLCCNPKHIYVGNQSDNMRDRHNPNRTRFSELANTSQETGRLDPSYINFNALGGG